MQQVNSKIRTARLRLGLTLVEVSELCRQRGVPAHNGQLSRYERGESAPRPRLRKALAEILGIDVTDFEPSPQATDADEPTKDVA